MNTHPHRFLALAVATLIPLAASCGDTTDGEDRADTPAGDTLIRPIERQPLDDDDLAGLDRERIDLELPWTSNRVTRDPGAAPRATVASIDTESHAAFDRVVVSLAGSTALPGYSVQFQESGSELACGGGAQTATLASDRLLVIRTTPSRAAREDGGRTVRTGTSRMDHARLVEGGLVCDEGDTTVWVAGLAEADEVRVFEMRDPYRLVVDLR